MKKNDKNISFDPQKLANLWKMGLGPEDEISQIGNYKIIRQLGEGGFGIVYLAQQQAPIQRQVALKIIKPGMDSKQVIARFEAERQALAPLEHPNIARIYDAGTTDNGRPYFVMEYIEGIPITEYCDHNKLSIEERLKLFIQVCEAVQHAHQKGIIHRDIKPSNIVASLQDGKAIPKVIDFGIAKAISTPLTEKTMFTQQGQLIGTPEYMSPEQADFKEGDIDTRTDIYSLGIVLYELLAGTLPFEPETLREAGFAEIQRIIREQEPPRPSTKLSSLGEDGVKVAQSRQTELSMLVKSLHRELEWIPLMAIRKDRDQRYKTVSDLAEDVQNYLYGNPLVAGPESRVYRFNKFIRKHKWSVVALTSIATIIVVSLIFIIPLYLQSEKSKYDSLLAKGNAEKSEKEALAAKAEAGGARMKAEEEALKAHEAEKLIQENIDLLKKQYYFNNITRIVNELNQNKFNDARQLLKECPEDLRQWEWFHLWRRLHGWLTNISAHQANLIAFHPNGKQLVSGGYQNEAIIWDIENTTVAHRLTGYKWGITSVIFNVQGTKLALVGDEIRVYDTENYSEPLKLGYMGSNRFPNFFDNVIFSPVKNQIIAGMGAYIRIYDSENGNLINTLSRNDRKFILILDIAISSDGNLIALGTDEKIISVWDVKSGIQIKSLTGHKSIVTSVFFNHDNTQIYSGSLDGTVRIWDIENEKELKVLGIYDGSKTSYVFNPDGTKFASGGKDGVINIYNINDGNIIMSLDSQGDRLERISFSRDGKRLATGSSNGHIKIWDAINNKSGIYILQGHHACVNSISFSKDDTQLISGGDDKTVRIWDVESGKEILCIDNYEAEVEYVAFNSENTNDKMFVSRTADNQIMIRDSNAEIKKLNYDNQNDTWNSVAFSPDGQWIAIGGFNDIVKVLDLKGFNEVIDISDANINCIRNISISNPLQYDSWYAQFLDHVGKFPNGVCSIIFNEDGTKIILGSNRGTIKILNTKDKSSICFSPVNQCYNVVLSLDLSPDEKYISVVGYDEKVRVYDLEDNYKERILEGHNGTVNAVAFCPLANNKRIASGGDDKIVRVWDIESGEQLLYLDDCKSEIKSVAFSPDGKRLAAGGKDGTIIIWDSIGPKEVERTNVEIQETAPYRIR
jgi:WD40 repeat protein/serine/threonine protein kinase